MILGKKFSNYQTHRRNDVQYSPGTSSHALSTTTTTHTILTNENISFIQNDYNLRPLMYSNTQLTKLDPVQNEAMIFVLACTKTYL